MSPELKTQITGIDPEKIRIDFPILDRKVHNKPLVYFDNAATTQKPQVVIDALVNYYTGLNSNVHRGVHYLSQQATVAFEEVRQKIQRFINARFCHNFYCIRIYLCWLYPGAEYFKFITGHTTHKTFCHLASA